MGRLTLSWLLVSWWVLGQLHEISGRYQSGGCVCEINPGVGSLPFEIGTPLSRSSRRSRGKIDHMENPSGRNARDVQKTQDVLRRARGILRRIDLAFDLFPDYPDRERQVAAMHNVVMLGRTVTFTLQNMQHSAPGFSAWYGPWQAEMKEDPLLRYFKDLRNQIEKQGREGASVSTHVHSFTVKDLPPAPPNAVNFFMGDQNGGDGWRVRAEDGRIEKIYVKLPQSMVTTVLGFDELPEKHLGRRIGDQTLKGVCRLYRGYLERIVTSAETTFAGSS